MITTGIVRRVDDLGRVVIPREIRHRLGITEGDPLEIFVEKDGVTFKPYHTKISKKLNTILNIVQQDEPFLTDINKQQKQIEVIKTAIQALEKIEEE